MEDYEKPLELKTQINTISFSLRLKEIAEDVDPHIFYGVINTIIVNFYVEHYDKATFMSTMERAYDIRLALREKEIRDSK